MGATGTWLRQVLVGRVTPVGSTQLESYSGLHEATCELLTPETIEEVTRIVAEATRQARRVTVRGGGLSFDAHALGTDLVLSLGGLDRVTVDAEARTVTAEGGARWGDVVAACLPHGLVPPVVVTGSGATVGGTLSANCHSRFSPTLGKEGHWVEWLDLVTASGALVRCSRTENPELFYGAIGGYGLLGVVVRATYRLLYVGAPVRVETMVSRHADLDGLAARVLPTLDDEEPTRTSYGILAVTGGRARVMVVSARLVSNVPLAPMVPHQTASPLRMPIEWLVHWVAPFGQAFWNFAYDHYVRETRPYVDEFAGYTFMMDAHTRARKAARRVGLAFRTTQTTFVIPGDDPSTGTSEHLSTFLEHALAQLRERGHDLALADVLWLPKDDEFGLSSTPDGGGYAVTFTFEAPGPAEMVRLESTLQEITEHCITLGGRVHLVKCVYATASQAERMYGAAAAKLFALKARWDPTRTFGNNLIDRLFPSASRG